MASAFKWLFRPKNKDTQAVALCIDNTTQPGWCGESTESQGGTTLARASPAESGSFGNHALPLDSTSVSVVKQLTDAHQSQRSFSSTSRHLSLLHRYSNSFKKQQVQPRDLSAAISSLTVLKDELHRFLKEQALFSEVQHFPSRDITGKLTKRQVLHKLGKLFKKSTAQVVLVHYCGASDSHGNWMLAADASVRDGMGGTSILDFHELSALWQQHRKHSQKLVLLLDCQQSGHWVRTFASLSKLEQLALSMAVQASDCASQEVPCSFPCGTFTESFMQHNGWQKAGGVQAAEPQGHAWLPGMQPSHHSTWMSDSMNQFGVHLRFVSPPVTKVPVDCLAPRLSGDHVAPQELDCTSCSGTSVPHAAMSAPLHEAPFPSVLTNNIAGTSLSACDGKDQYTTHARSSTNPADAGLCHHNVHSPSNSIPLSFMHGTDGAATTLGHQDHAAQHQSYNSSDESGDISGRFFQLIAHDDNLAITHASAGSFAGYSSGDVVVLHDESRARRASAPAMDRAVLSQMLLQEQGRQQRHNRRVELEGDECLDAVLDDALGLSRSSSISSLASLPPMLQGVSEDRSLLPLDLLSPAATPSASGLTSPSSGRKTSVGKIWEAHNAHRGSSDLVRSPSRLRQASMSGQEPTWASSTLLINLEGTELDAASAMTSPLSLQSPQQQPGGQPSRLHLASLYGDEMLEGAAGALSLLQGACSEHSDGLATAATPQPAVAHGGAGKGATRSRKHGSTGGLLALFPGFMQRASSGQSLHSLEANAMVAASDAATNSSKHHFLRELSIMSEIGLDVNHSPTGSIMVPNRGGRAGRFEVCGSESSFSLYGDDEERFRMLKELHHDDISHFASHDGSTAMQ